MKKRPLKKAKPDVDLVAIALSLILISAALVIFAGPNFDFAPISGLAARAAPQADGKAVVNPLATVRQQELQAAQLKKDLVNLEQAKLSGMLNATLQNSSRVEKNRIRSNYDTQISQKQSQLNIKERQLDTAYTALYRTYIRDNDALSKIALAQVATLTRRNFGQKSATELTIINRDCSGGIIEDALLFRYADAWASENYQLAASEAGRIANQFACLSERQSLLLDKALTKAMQQAERQIERNPEADRLFLAGAFQPLLLSLDNNVHLNPESLRFMEDHKEDQVAMFTNKSGEKMAKMGFWLLDRTSGEFEQYNPCGSTHCATGIELVNSLNRKNWGLGDCTLSEMIKAGPVQSKGFICDKVMCESAFDADAIQKVEQTIGEILQGSGNVAAGNAGRLPQQERQNAGQEQTPRAPGIGGEQASGQTTQFNTNLAAAQNDICSKRRARGRAANRGETQVTPPCGVSANSMAGPRSNSQPFRCQKANGETKSFNGIGNDASCKVGQETERPYADYRRAMDNIKAQYGTYAETHYTPNELGHLENLREDAQAYLDDDRNFQAISEAYSQEHGVSLSNQDRETMKEAIGNSMFVRDQEALDACDPAAGCTLDNDVVINTDQLAGSGANRGITRDQMAVLALVHESVHVISYDNGIHDSDIHSGEKDHNALRKVNLNQCEGSEDCSCNALAAKLGTLEGCFGRSLGHDRSGRVGQAAGRGPVRDPSGGDDNIGSSGSGTFNGLQSCFSGGRASGVPKIDCSAAIQCPSNQFAMAVKTGGIDRCGCTNKGASGISGSGARTGIQGPIRDPAAVGANDQFGIGGNQQPQIDAEVGNAAGGAAGQAVNR